MSKPIIEVKNLSKVYNIGHEQKSAPGTLTLRDSITQTLRKPLEVFTGHKMEQEKFWALKNINLDIRPGDTVGLIGRNGSGKSTFLKILSRIVEPTSGEIIMRGRSASLLEVGTGFHPELTGRENIFFNGAILGMSQKEIRSKFDDIVTFSGVEKFLDTPVKFYSSGMYVRLAFAVAAHLEPDILIVDEVLAVGDAEFQKKSLGKMKDVTADKNRTVIFVSHSMEAIQSICNKVAWISAGGVKEFGETDKVVSAYQRYNTSSDSQKVEDRKDRQGTGRVRVSGNISNLLNATIGKRIIIKPGLNKLEVMIKNVNLVPGEYLVNTFLAKDQSNSEIFDWVEAATSFRVPAYDYYMQGSAPVVNGKVVYLDYEINQ
jgi:lipopolysaccharide transport system ATP-binding protein